MSDRTDGPQKTVRAILAADPSGAPAHIAEVATDDLGDGEVTIEVKWSGFNYKDALAVTGRAPVVRHHPMICGIDLAGVVISSMSEEITVGDEVVVTGYGLGEDRNGGYASLARVPASSCEVVPHGLSSADTMLFGTAGVTAALCLMALERNGVTPESANGLPLLITGAAGGVGSIAVALCAQAGYEVVASTGRTSEEPFLRSLGASGVVSRDELSQGATRPLDRVRYQGAIDVVGGTTLAAVISRLAPGATVAACGLAGGSDLVTTVYPFILRGVTLAGVFSGTLAPDERREVWRRLAGALSPALRQVATTEPVARALELADTLLAGGVRGRVIFDVASLSHAE